MSGLSNILSAIEESAAAQVAQINAETGEQTAKIESDALARGEKIKADILAQADAQAQKITDSAAVSAKTQVSRALLGAKVYEVNEAINTACQRVASLPDDRYFAVMENLAVKAAANHGGELCFSADDLKRLPDSFQKSLNSRLAQGVSVKISNQPANIQNGFLLKHDDIEENCTLAAVVEGKSEELKDAVAKILFAEE